MSKKLIIFISGYILCFILFIVLVNISYKKDNIDRIEYNYDSMKSGQIIPFNSKIKGDFYFYGVYTANHNHYYYFTKKGYVQNFVKACYCKDESCLETKKCDKEFPLVSLGKDNHFSYYVESYTKLFKEKKDYTGWKIYYVPIDYMEVYKDYAESFIGSYYDLYFIPTNDTRNNLDNALYYKRIDYKVKSNKNTSNDIIELLDEGKYSMEFSAKKDDIISFEIKTSDDNLKVLLNDEEINNELELDNDIKTNKNNSKYWTKIYNIKKDGKYTLSFVTTKKDNTKEKNYVNYIKYTYLKNINILSETKNKEEISNYIIKTKDEYIVGEYSE